MIKLLIFIGMLCLSMSSEPSFGWGTQGHKLIGSMTWGLLSPNAKREVSKLLSVDAIKDDPCHSSNMESASTWLDCVRVKHLKLPFPFFTNMPHVEHIGLNDKSLIAFAPWDINNPIFYIYMSRQILLDKAANSSQKNIALRVFIHLVEDIHQPLHVVTFLGKYQHIKIKNNKNAKAWNLHGYWDIVPVESIIDNHKEYKVTDAIKKLDREKIDFSPQSWSIEALSQTAKIVLHNLPDKFDSTGKRAVVLSHSYIIQSNNLVAYKIAEASVRLAHELNYIFDMQ